MFVRGKPERHPRHRKSSPSTSDRWQTLYTSGKIIDSSARLQSRNATVSEAFQEVGNLLSEMDGISLAEEDNTVESVGDNKNRHLVEISLHV